MAVKHPPEVRNSFCTYLLSQLDESSKPGILELQTATDSVVATLTFSRPAFGPPIDGVAKANPIESDMNAIGGVVAKALFKNGDKQEKFVCSVTGPGGGGDIELSAVRIPFGLEVEIPHLTYTAPL